MKKTMLLTALLCLVLAQVALCETAKATLCNSQADTLTSLKGIMVGIEPQGTEFASAGLTKEAIQSIVEARLKAAGINVLQNGPDVKPAKENGYLVVRVEVTNADVKSGKALACSVELRLFQYVFLMNRTDHYAIVPTWLDIRTFACDSGCAIRVGDNLGSIADGFAKDFVAANPKS